MKTIKVVLLSIIFSTSGFGQTQLQIENLKTFAKVYGYVKYFHPSDEAANLNWDQFAIYGAAQVEKCQTKAELLNTLNALFLPIAPAIRFYNTGEDTKFDLGSITPDKPKKYKTTYWQHEGVSYGMDYRRGTYKSIRVNRKTEMMGKINNMKIGYGEKIFYKEPIIGEVINKDIGSGISCIIPLVLYCRNDHTYPLANRNGLDSQLGLVGTYDPRSLSLRHGSIIITWNIFKHFYPYFDVVKVDWEKEMETALSKCYKDRNRNDFMMTLQQFTAPVKDGHIRVSGGTLQLSRPPISWEWIENKLVITEVCDSNLNLKVGDIVTEIDSMTPEKYFEMIESRISAGTPGWMAYRANLESLVGGRFIKLNIVANNKRMELRRNSDVYAKGCNQGSFAQKTAYRFLQDSIIYLNIDIIEMKTIDSLLPELKKARAIICDLRGYPNSNHKFINYLLKENDNDKWMFVPRFIYPDQENLAGYADYGWSMRIMEPHLKAKIIFIIDGSAISYAESYMGFIEGHKLATIIGQPTAGTNGNVNNFSLPGGYYIFWTGMKVLKHDGSQQHGIGILPNVYVSKTIQGVKEGRDEFLEKAIELAKKPE